MSQSSSAVRQSARASQPQVGIGACLVGQPVRYNGESKRKNAYIDALGEHLALNAFCPEVAIGLGVPRETVRLVGDIGAVKLVDSATQTIEYTVDMQNYAATVFTNNAEMAGYILVKGSPSCGFERVKRYNERGNPLGSDAMGVFADALRRLDPLLPMEEDGRLNDHRLRENFINRVYTYHEWKKLRAEGISLHRLTAFWSSHKYLVMAHHVPSYQAIGRLLANADGEYIDELAETFIRLLMESLQKMATRKSHSNVLEHLRGYLKKHLNGDDKAELGRLIEQYRVGMVPLIVPLTMLRHHFRLHRNPYIERQSFLAPYPEQLGLRNNI